jgi:hypothetical protein
VPWGSGLKANQHLDFMEQLHHCILSLSLSELQLFAVITWFIPYRRNWLWLNLPIEALNQLVPRAQKLLSEFQEVQESSTQPTRQAVPFQRVTWSPTQPGRYKVNYDVAFFGDSNEAGIGVIIRNHNGEVMASLCHRVHYPHLIKAMEAYAARSAIQMAIDLGL